MGVNITLKTIQQNLIFMLYNIILIDCAHNFNY